MQYNVLAEYLPKLKLSGPDWPREGFGFPSKLEIELDITNPSFVKKSLQTDLYYNLEAIFMLDLTVLLKFCRNSRPEIFKLLVDIENEDLDDVEFCEKIINPITISDDAEGSPVDVKFEVDVKHQQQEDCGGV